MQKKFFLAFLLLAVCTMSWAAPASASQLSFDATHSLIISLTHEDGTALSPYSGYISAYTSGRAELEEDSDLFIDILSLATRTPPPPLFLQ